MPVGCGIPLALGESAVAPGDEELGVDGGALDVAEVVVVEWVGALTPLGAEALAGFAEV